MVGDEVVREIQRLYPLLYFACHRSHARDDGLGESDLRLHGLDPEAIEAILSGLDEEQRDLVVDALRLLADAIRRHES